MIRTEIAGNDGAIIRGLTNLNVVVGRNGSGKSRLLRSLDETLSKDDEFNARYISPERAGVFERIGNISTNIDRDPTWLSNTRRQNQAEQFKQASAHLLRELEVIYNRRVLRTPALRLDPVCSFETDLLQRIGGLLPNITIEQRESTFVFLSANGEQVNANHLSSGESETIALATEMLYFFETLRVDRFNLLLVDEPDVHLHPDLQARLATFMVESIAALEPAIRERVALVVSTHSTPLICALSTSEFTSIGIKDFQNNVVQQVPASDQLKKAAPFFGHPLSLTISGDALLILEGEDDERVWQQAARTSQGRIRLFPILARSVNQQFQLENYCATLLQALFDRPVAFSLRDGDGVREALQPIGPVLRFRISCYAIENALLTDEALRVLGTTWDRFKEQAAAWLAENPLHKDRTLIQELIASADRLRDTKIKAIRDAIVGIVGSRKPWETVIGQAIGALNLADAAETPTSLLTYIGRDAAHQLLRSSR